MSCSVQNRAEHQRPPLGEYKNTLCTEFNSLTVMHLFVYFYLLTLLSLSVASKITDGNPLKAKLDIFIEEQKATSVESLWKKTTDHESLGLLA